MQQRRALRAWSAARLATWPARAAGALAMVWACGAAAACGSSSGTPSNPGSGTTKDSGVDVQAPVLDSGQGGGGIDSAAADTSTLTFGDATQPPGVDSAAGCQHLNIGILGHPGANPSSDFDAWLTSAGTSVTRIQNVAPAPTITAATLQPFDVVLLDWLTRDYTAAEAQVFSSFVSAGGGAISMSGYDNNTTDDWHANSLLSPLSVAYADPFFEAGPVTDFATFPITMGITSVTFDGGYAVSDLGGAMGTRTPIGFLPDPTTGMPDPVAMAVTFGTGHAFVWGDEWISFDSEWATMPQIEQLWVQVFAWVAPANKCQLTPPQ